jgi:hypothetical protein
VSRERLQITIGPALFALCALLALAAETFVLAVYAPDRVVAKGRHESLIPEFGSGVPISQIFQATANGLQEIRVLLHAEQATEAGMDWMLAEERDSAWTMVVAGHRRLALPSGSHWYEIAFPPIEASAGHAYRLTLQRNPSAAVGQPSVALAAWLDNPLGNGFLSVGAEDRWGDLQFEARAKGDTIAGRFELDVARHLQPPFNRIGTWTALVVLLNVLLALFAAGHTVREPTPDSRFATLPLVPSLVLTILLAAATVTTIAIAGGSDTRIDLIDEMYRAHWTSVPPLHWGLDVRDTTIGAETLQAVFAHPSSSITWTLTLPPRAHLRTSLGIDPGAWPMDLSDGVQFRVGVQSGTAAEELLVQHVDPHRVAGDQRWIPVDLDLSRFAGQEVKLTLSTDPSAPGVPPSSFYDWALWGAPRITSGR